MIEKLKNKRNIIISVKYEDSQKFLKYIKVISKQIGIEINYNILKNVIKNNILSYREYYYIYFNINNIHNTNDNYLLLYD